MRSFGASGQGAVARDLPETRAVAPRRPGPRGRAAAVKRRETVDWVDEAA